MSCGAGNSACQDIRRNINPKLEELERRLQKVEAELRKLTVTHTKMK